jgi:hypothetical protein
MWGGGELELVASGGWSEKKDKNKGVGAHPKINFVHGPSPVSGTSVVNDPLVMGHRP